MASGFNIDPDITIATTPEGSFYGDEAMHAAVCDRVFARTWQWLGDTGDVLAPGSLSPRMLVPGCLDEPVLLARDREGALRCMSNVCTHRGNILVKAPCRMSEIRCGYHARCFDLHGHMTFMPEFDRARDFPRGDDDLPEVPLALWGTQAFAALDPAASFEAFMGDVQRRVPWLRPEELHHDPAADRDFHVGANWALYVENYLEGLHIPFVHPALHKALDYANYTTELYRYASLQLAAAREGEAGFDLPRETPDHGRRIAAYYFWIFPNLMLNVYPWGVSLNAVLPLGRERTRIAFRSYVRDTGDSAPRAAALEGLDQVELEDEGIVEQVQIGVRSRLYGRGRYSPTREQGVHHFHRLLAEFLNP